jgi:hypothetical protein
LIDSESNYDLPVQLDLGHLFQRIRNHGFRICRARLAVLPLIDL